MNYIMRIDGSNQEIKVLQKTFRKVVAISIATTGQDPTEHKTIAVALKIFDTTSGDTLGQYNSIIKISEEDWKNSEPIAQNIHKISYEEVEKYGNLPQNVAYDISVLFHARHITSENSCFLFFASSSQKHFIDQIIPNGFTKFKESLPSYILKRGIISRKRLKKSFETYKLNSVCLSPSQTVILTSYISQNCTFTVAACAHISLKGFLQRYGIQCKEEHYRPTDVVDKIHQVFMKMIPKPNKNSRKRDSSHISINHPSKRS